MRRLYIGAWMLWLLYITLVLVRLVAYRRATPADWPAGFAIRQAVALILVALVPGIPLLVRRLRRLPPAPGSVAARLGYGLGALLLAGIPVFALGSRVIGYQMPASPEMPLAERSLQLPAVLELSGRTTSGAPWQFRAAPDKVVVVDFWASWCAPCLASFDDLRRLHDTFGDNPDFELVMLSIDDDVDAALNVITTRKPPGTQIVGAHRSFTAMGGSFIPTTLLVARGAPPERIDARRPGVEASIRAALDARRR